MSTRKQISESEGVYFITITCHAWLPLYEITDGYDIAYKWFDHMKGKGHYILAYVVMPNHLHALIAFSRTEPSINSIVGNGKRFMAYELVKRLIKKGEDNILDALVEGVSKRDYKRGKLHEVFKPSFDWKDCRSNGFINQKLNYIHNNPCKGKWNLAESPMDYSHSSAKFYLTGQQGVYEVFHFGMIQDIDLTNSKNE